MANAKECLDAYEKAGCLDLAAEMLNEPRHRVATKIRRHLKNTGQDYEWFSRNHQVDTINKYMDKPYLYVSQMIAQPTVDKIAICAVDGVIKYMRPEKIEGDLIGVYDRNGNANQRREDIYWYVKTYLETDNANS